MVGSTRRCSSWTPRFPSRILSCFARLMSIGVEATIVCLYPSALAPTPLWMGSSTGARQRFLPSHSSAIFLRTCSSFSLAAVPQKTTGTSTASTTFLARAAASSAGLLSPLGSVLLSWTTITFASYSFTHFLAHAGGSEITSLNGSTAASGQLSGSISHISMAIMGGWGMFPSKR